LSRQEVVEEHFRAGGRPHGHGFTRRNRDAGTAYYVFDLPGATIPIRGITLDTVNYNGEADGSLDQAQFAWLERQLVAVHTRYLDANGHIRRGGARHDHLVVLFSHHGLHSLNNRIPAVDEPGPRVLADEVLALLLRFPNLVVWVNGHSHVNAIYAHPQTKGARLGGGFWEVNTASHIDWPEQARLVEIVDNVDGTLSIFGTIVDSAAPASNHGRLDTPLQLAALSRELAVNDPQERQTHRRGDPSDRNVELLVAAPFDVTAARLRRRHSTVPVPGGDHGRQNPLATTGGGRRALLTGAALTGAAAAVAAVRRRGDEA
jgi:metallophosphoesterase (TIGR03767 family)